MARLGRKPQGYQLIDRLDGDSRYKARLKGFLDTLTGQSTVNQACEKLGMGPSRFFDLRNRWLQAALDLLAPKQAGRPRKVADAEPRVLELERQLRDVEQRLKSAELRADLAEAGVARPARERRKKGAPR